MANDTPSSFDGAILLTDQLEYARSGRGDRAIVAEGLVTGRHDAGSPALDPDAIDPSATASAQARQDADR
jgi:hypothetical protein